jgi:DNA-binding YbaB/EbfC family protein
MNRDMMARISQMQEQLQKAQEDIENRVATATAGGGAVTVSINGAYKIQALKIDPEVVDPADVAMLEDLVTAALNEAPQQVQSFHSDQLAGLTGGIDLSSLGLPGLPGLPGGGGGGAPGGGQAPLNRAARRNSKR